MVTVPRGAANGAPGPRSSPAAAGSPARTGGKPRSDGPVAGGSRQVAGRLVGLEGQAGNETVVLEVEGERVAIALSDIAKATLVYEFAGEP